jgi:light-regulated signal transduction histidine kinase (bacteriophytochrome)
MSSFAPHDLINEVTNMLDAQIKEKNAVIHFNKMPAIHADRLQVLQLFQNLITNAIKFCAPSRIPVIHIKAKPIDKFIQFKLKDNGIGIAKKYHKELFMPFKKFHSRSEGSMYGIGLSLCKKIVTNHGGSIKFSSRENLGTTFTFLLPSSEIN